MIDHVRADVPAQMVRVKCHFYEPPAHNGNLAAGAGTDVQAILRRRQMTQMFHDHAAESDIAALLGLGLSREFWELF